jgi:hypothetical protein
VELSVADVERDHARRAALQQNVGEPAGRGTDVEGIETGDVDPERIERVRELVPGAGDIGRRRLNLERRLLVDLPVTIRRSGLILLLISTPGTANAIAQAIDESDLREQEGTLAGDNTLLVLFADEDHLNRWQQRLERIRAVATLTSAAPLT